MRPTLTATDLFGSRGRVDVLRILWGVNVPMTAADVARRSRLTHPAATAVLRSLAHEGLVATGPAGRGHTYWIVRDNVYVESFLDPAFNAERQVPEILAGELSEKLGPLAISIVMFGSYARGQQSTESDIDIVVVTQDESAKVDLAAALPEVTHRFRRRFGASLSALVYARREAADLAVRSPQLWASIQAEGVTVFGLSANEWAANESA
jgi:predicted nucleotidyltransferase